ARWGVRVSAHAFAYREEHLDTGMIDWTRIAVGLGPTFRIPWRRSELDFATLVTGALLLLSSRGFAETRDDNGFDPGFEAGVRWVTAFPSLRLKGWVEASCSAWPRDQVAHVGGHVTTVVLPHVDGLLSAGFSWTSSR